MLRHDKILTTASGPARYPVLGHLPVVVCNVNDPRSAIAWADAIIGFGEWLIPEAGRMTVATEVPVEYRSASIIE